MEEQNTPKALTEVTVIESGPLKISGNISLKDLQKGTESKETEIWLCRCGKSSNKPFCDESHKRK